MRRVIPVLLLALVAASCSSDSSDGASTASAANATTTTTEPATGGEPFAIVASSDLAVGENRFLIGFRDFDGTLLGSPSESLELTVHPDGQPDATQTVDGSFLWIVPDLTGLYRAELDFEVTGTWMVDAKLGGRDIPTASFTVRPEPQAAAIGQAGPPSVTPTGSNSALKDITSDPSPDPRFYRLSVDEALQSGMPNVIIFATPAFCNSQACGPMVDQMKVLADSRPEVNWVHVEVYENIQDPANLTFVPAITEWGLPTEPWLFVTDANGIVRARFEGVVDPVEVVEALDQL